jgi:hypothetical protein
VAGSDVLSEEFGELAKFDQAPGGVIEEVPLGKSSEAGEALVVGSEKIEITEHPHWSGLYAVEK